MSKAKEMSSRVSSTVKAILVLQLIFSVTIFLNISVVRQIVGFLYLTLVPGFLILKLLKLNKFSAVETVLFSVGLSVAFLFITGLAINELGLFLGVSKPLEANLVFPAISGFVLLLTFAYHIQSPRNQNPMGLDKKILTKSLFLALIPILSIIGAFWANATGNTSVLLLVLFVILVVFGIAVFSERIVAQKMHLVLVIVIAVALLFQWSLVSQYVQGYDIKLENYVFGLTQQAGHWNVNAFFTDLSVEKFYSALSVTLLPTIYSNVLSLDGSIVFKVIYPLIFAFVPLALYLIWREKLGARIALLSSFLFMSQITFFAELTSLARQMIAELFFVLLFMILFSKKISAKNFYILFIVFSFSLIVSHYAMALMFLFFVFVMSFSGFLNKKSSRNLNLRLVMLFSTLMFSWYLFTSSSAIMESYALSSNRIISALGDFLLPASRSQGVLMGLGLTAAPTPLNAVSRYISYATELFIIVGFLVLVLQRKKKDFDFENILLCSACLVILAMCILLPSFASAFNVTRFYHVLLFFLAPLFAIGWIGFFRFVGRLSRFASKRKLENFCLILMVVLLGAYFLFQTNLVYEVANSESWSLPLSRYRLGPSLYTQFLYVTEPEVSGAQWLSQHASSTNLLVYADLSAESVLSAYGGIYPGSIGTLTNVTLPRIGEFVYLGELSVVYGKVQGIDTWNTSDVLGSTPLNLIYSNGHCEIYEGTIATP